MKSFNKVLISAKSFLDVSKMYILRSFLRLEVYTICFLLPNAYFRLGLSRYQTHG